VKPPSAETPCIYNNISAIEHSDSQMKSARCAEPKERHPILPSLLREWTTTS
jgi:hypothetical protein